MYTMTQADWQLLIDQINDGTCTPFLGAGASVPYVETGTALSRRWAQEQGFPLPDPWNLPRVAQFMALNIEAMLWDPAIPKRKMIEYLKSRRRPLYSDPAEVYATLADLPFKVVLTTNYDSYMTEAFAHKHKNPRRDFCRWNRRLVARYRPDQPSEEPSIACPLVYHLHGHDKIVDSLVLTEDDYVDFTVNVSQRPETIPTPVQDAITDNTLMFLGYSLNDWNFRVLFRTMQGYLENSTRGGHVAVLLLPETDAQADPVWLDRAVRFFERYLQNQRIVVYWGSCSDFLQELRRQFKVTTSV
jgi:hypothetical protein